eukprot:1628499-Alexandrium_andersonii.AAC.1
MGVALNDLFPGVFGLFTGVLFETAFLLKSCSPERPFVCIVKKLKGRTTKRMRCVLLDGARVHKSYKVKRRNGCIVYFLTEP